MLTMIACDHALPWVLLILTEVKRNKCNVVSMHATEFRTMCFCYARHFTHRKRRKLMNFHVNLQPSSQFNCFRCIHSSSLFHRWVFIRCSAVFLLPDAKTAIAISSKRGCVQLHNSDCLHVNDFFIHDFLC